MIKKTIECNTKEQIRNCFMEIKNIAFEKLNDLEFKNITRFGVANRCSKLFRL